MIVLARRTVSARREVHRALFNKYDENQIRIMEDRRIRELMCRSCEDLTPRQESELNAFIARQCESVRAHWTPAQEAKRRGVNPFEVKTFVDSQGRHLPALFAASVPVGQSPNDESERDS